MAFPLEPRDVSQDMAFLGTLLTEGLVYGRTATGDATERVLSVPNVFGDEPIRLAEFTTIPPLSLSRTDYAELPTTADSRLIVGLDANGTFTGQRAILPNNAALITEGFSLWQPTVEGIYNRHIGWLCLRCYTGGLIRRADDSAHTPIATALQDQRQRITDAHTTSPLAVRCNRATLEGYATPPSNIFVRRPEAN